MQSSSQLSTLNLTQQAFKLQRTNYRLDGYQSIVWLSIELKSMATKYEHLPQRGGEKKFPHLISST